MKQPCEYDYAEAMDAVAAEHERHAKQLFMFACWVVVVCVAAYFWWRP